MSTFFDLEEDEMQQSFDFPLERENVLRVLAHTAKEFPNEMIAALLATHWWPTHLETMENYSVKRYEDDSRFGMLTVTISEDADAWIDVLSEADPNELHTIMRFRTFIGGGQSPRVRNALLILAEAIRLDNKDRPQRR